MQTFVEIQSYKTSLLPLVKPLADKGAGSSWASWVGLQIIQQKPIHKTKERFTTSPANSSDVQNIHYAEEASKVIAVSNQFSGDMHALDEKVNSMLEKSQNMVQCGKQANGRPKQATAFICKVCGKEGTRHHIIDHIEANQLEGISIPCDYCDKAFSGRQSLRQHKARYHK